MAIGHGYLLELKLFVFQSGAFERPDGAMVVIVTNQHVDQTIKIKIQTSDGKISSPITIGPQSVHSFIWM